MSRLEMIEQLVQQASRLAGEAPQDIEAKLRVLVQGALSRMDLVTRDEFDAQAAVLMRTREKLQQLEQQFAELQALVDAGEPKQN
ncbi:MAG: hypothetical protein CMN84_06215 [Spongiibacteraceae bacterium]|jgi:ubiquinone biosynthesis accessory factor UbiK|nr:hypothetical protein [Spongiibacteraceae bacterium]